ncbi:MAG: ROK family protein [Chloroflexota bacterium]|nr:ROK family protein [Chloroflexota bacterium]
MTPPASAAGRGSQRAAPAARLAPALALDVGGTRLRGAVVGPDGRLISRHAINTPGGDADTLVGACVRVLQAALAEAGPMAAAPVAIGISAPGPLDARSGRLIDPPNLDRTTWGMPLAGLIADALGLPAALEKDTNVAALGEGTFGAARDVDDFIYLTVSTGVGGAVVSGRRLLRGPDGVAGELGHLVVDAFAGPRCGCGARGHLEALASGTGIAVAALEEGFGVRSSAADVATAAERGDERAARIIERARAAFAAAIVTIVDVFNPSMVVVGGGVAAGQGERLLRPARERVAAEAFAVQARRAKIVPAQLGDDVCLVGALVLANAALNPGLAPLGLKPRATRPGRSALPKRPPGGDDEGGIIPTTTAVATR